MAKTKPPLTFAVDASQMSQYAERLSKWSAALPNAMLQAINKTLPQGRRQTAKLLAGRDEGKGKYNVRQKDVIDKIKINRASRTQDVYTGKLTIDSGRRLGLNYFEAEQTPATVKGMPKNTPTQVTYKVLKGGSKKVIPNAIVRQGQVGRWVAINSKDYKGQGVGLPHQKQTRDKRLVFLQGISVWGMVAGLGNQAKIGEYMAKKFSENVAKMIAFQETERSNPNSRMRFDADGYMMRGKKK
jgi:hypothetical protein